MDDVDLVFELRVGFFTNAGEQLVGTEKIR